MMGGRVCVCACVYLCFLVGCGVAREGGLAERLPHCWEIEGVQGEGFLFKGGPKSAPKEP